MRTTAWIMGVAILGIGPGMVNAEPKAIPKPPMFADRSMPQPCANGCINPIEAVTFASYLGQKAGVAGDFEMTVRAVGRDNGRLFLNSESDYRDRNCLTVAIADVMVGHLFQTTDLATIQRRLIGKRIVVSGIARQVRVDLTQDGQATGKYYYQVHVKVDAARQMRVLPRT